MTRSVKVSLAVGLIVVGLAVLTVLTRSPIIVAGTNSISAKDYIELEAKDKLSNCQPAGTLPQGTSAIRIGVEGLYFSPTVTAKVFTGSRVLAEGRHNAGGASIPNVTVPVSKLTHAVRGAHICTTIGPAREPIRFYGAPGHSSTSTTNPLQGASLQVEYLRPGTKSWWSFVSSIAYHMGLGHAPSGTWVAFLVLALMLAVIVLVSRLIVEELR
jgi:hypothetical protein